MSFTNYTIIPPDNNVFLDGKSAFNVSMEGIPANVHAIQWYGLRGEGIVEYQIDPLTGELPPPESFTDPDTYIDQIAEAESIIYAYENPVTYYVTRDGFNYGGLFYYTGSPVIINTPDTPQPAFTTLTEPPSVPRPVRASFQVKGNPFLQWDGSNWVVSSFSITMSLSEAQDQLVKDVTFNGAQYVNQELTLYSQVEQIEAPSVLNLDCYSYPGTTIGEYQTYVSDVVAAAIVEINSFTTVEDLYSFDPASLPYKPSASGFILTGRGAGLGPEDLNLSYYTVFTSSSLSESETELYVPGTDTVIPYTIDPEIHDGGFFDSAGNCFNPGDYLIQIRQVPNGLVLSEFEVPLNPASENVAF